MVTGRLRAGDSGVLGGVWPAVRQSRYGPGSRTDTSVTSAGRNPRGRDLEEDLVDAGKSRPAACRVDHAEADVFALACSSIYPAEVHFASTTTRRLPDDYPVVPEPETDLRLDGD